MTDAHNGHAIHYDTTANMGVASVTADHKTTFVKDTTRLEFLERYIPYWRLSRQYRAYSLMLAFVGIVMLIRSPILAAPAFAAAGYFHVAGKLKAWYAQGAYADHRTNILAD